MADEALSAETVHMRGHLGDQIDAYLARPFVNSGRGAGSPAEEGGQRCP